MEDVQLVDVDLDVWIPAPFPLRLLPDGPSEEEWAAEWAGLAWVGLEASADQVELTRRQLLLVGVRSFPEEGTWDEKWLHLPDPGGFPVPVMVARFEAWGPREVTLRRLVRDGAPRGERATVVDSVVTPLGTAVRGRAFSSPVPRGVVMPTETVSYAWRVEGVGGRDLDVVLYGGYDPQRMRQVEGDLERLAMSMTRVTIEVDDA